MILDEERVMTFLTHAQADSALRNVAEGICPFGHGRLDTDLSANVGWCGPCSREQGVDVGYRLVAGTDGPCWTDTTSGDLNAEARRREADASEESA